MEMMLRSAILCFALLAAVLAQPGSRSTSPGRYIIKLKDSPRLAEDQKRVSDRIEAGGGRIVDTLKGSMKALIVDADEKTITLIRKMPGVELVKADRKVPLKPLPRKP